MGVSQLGRKLQGVSQLGRKLQRVSQLGRKLQRVSQLGRKLQRVSQLGRKLQRVLLVETLLAPSQESQKRRMVDGLTEELTEVCGIRRHAVEVLWN